MAFNEQIRLNLPCNRPIVVTTWVSSSFASNWHHPHRCRRHRLLCVSLLTLNVMASEPMCLWVCIEWLTDWLNWLQALKICALGLPFLLCTFYGFNQKMGNHSYWLQWWRWWWWYWCTTCVNCNKRQQHRVAATQSILYICFVIKFSWILNEWRMFIWNRC